MKKIISYLLSFILALSICPQLPAGAAADAGEAQVAQRLFQYLNPKDQRTAQIYQAYQKRDYTQALSLYRNYFVDKLRQINVGNLGWHDSNISSTYVAMADILCGKMTVQQFNTKFGERAHYDYMEWNGDPYAEPNFNWLGGMGVPANAQSDGQGFEVNMRNLNKLAGAYWVNGGDIIYMDKYFQIINDYCQNQKRITDQYLEENPGIEPDVRFWMTGGKYAQNYLWLFERSNNVLRSLAIFFKLLPAEAQDGKPEWADVTLPVDTKLLPESYEKVDPVMVANIAYSFITDHLSLMQNVLADNFLIANQHSEGVLAFARLMDMFDEFTICDQYDQKLDHALNYLIESIILPDGSLTERSFNYNVGTVEGYNTIMEWLSYRNQELPGWSESFSEAIRGWNRLYAAYLSANGTAVNIGNSTESEYASPIWRDEQAYQKLKESYQDKIDPNMNFLSIYFPYGGYGVMRSGWDIREDMTLNFYNNYKKSAGHRAMIVNGVWLTAYGRPLISSGSCGWYGEGFAPESQLPIYNQLNVYFDENSTYKGSTVIVNGKDQAEPTVPAEELLNARWMAGENFDYGEGRWDGGYKSDGKSTGDAVHDRRFFYLKDAALYVVEDTLTSQRAEENTYSQIWRMPCFNREVTNLTGFPDEQVLVDEAENVIKTADPTGPNVWISDFSGEELTYAKYYGYQGDRFIGWSRGGFGGERLPAVDVHVSWKGAGNLGKTKVVSILDPVRDMTVPYTQKENLSDREKGITGFRYVTEDNVRVTYYAASEPAEFICGDIQAKAQLLVVTEKEGQAANGFCMGAVSAGIGGQLPVSSDAFEFTVVDGQLKVLTTPVQPTYFQWIDQQDGKYYPKYDSLDKESVEAMVNAVTDQTNAFRILSYSDAKRYSIRYAEVVAESIIANLGALPEIPSEKLQAQYLDAVAAFVDKNLELAVYYSRQEYTNSVMGVLSKLYAACGAYAQENQEIAQYQQAYLRIMDKIREASNTLGVDGVSLENMGAVPEVPAETLEEQCG